MENFILRTDNISKKYGGRYVLNNICINIKQGEICGFIGPNGAGKSTLIKIVMGIASPTSGGIEIFGQSDYKSILSARDKIGCIIENPSLYPNFDAYANIKAACLFLGINYTQEFANEKLELVGLNEVGNKKAKNYSLGMKQRLAIALALLKDPEFLILDEPTNGLDPKGIMEIRETVLRLNREKGITFLICSHILLELSKVVTKYVIISRGNIIEEITADEISKKSQSVLAVVVDNVVKAIEVLKTLGGTDVMVENNKLSSKILANDVKAVTKKLIEADVNITSIGVAGEDAETYLINKMNQNDR